MSCIVRTAYRFADLDDAVDMLWGVLHGLVSLHMNGRMEEGQQHTRLLMEQTVRLLLRAWRTQTK